MKASELRIGNWIQDRHGDAYQVWSLLKIASHDTINDDTISDWKPIPLTEEWLLKLGFESSRLHIKNYLHPATMHFELRNVSVLDGGFKIIAGNSEPNYFKGISKELKYVHQLQNLYFALTGTELQIKEKV